MGAYSNIFLSHVPKSSNCKDDHYFISRGFKNLLQFFPPYLKNKNYVGVEYVGAGTLEGLLAGMVDYVSSVRGKPRAWPIMDPVR